MTAGPVDTPRWKPSDSYLIYVQAGLSVMT